MSGSKKWFDKQEMVYLAMSSSKGMTSQVSDDSDSSDRSKEYISYIIDDSSDREPNDTEPLLRKCVLEPRLKEFIPEPSRGRQIVTMAACLFLLMSSYGVVEALGVLYVELVDFFNAPRSVAALVQSIYNGCCLGGGILFRCLFTTYDSGYVIAVASLCASITFCFSCLAPSIEMVILLIGVLTGLACSVNVLGSFVIASWMFHRNRKLALGVLTLGATLGQTTLPYLATVLIDYYSWSGTVLIMGGMMYLNCIPCGLLVHFSKPYFNKGDLEKLKRSKLFDLDTFKDVAFVILLSTYLSAKAAGQVEQLFVVDMSVVKGFTMSMGASLLTLNGVFAFTGRSCGTFILRRYPNTRLELHLLFWYSTWAVSHMVISQSPTYFGMVVGIFIRGLSLGVVTTILPGLQVELGGIEKFPQILSTCNLMKGVGAIVGGYLGGLGFDITNSYNWVFSIASALNMYNAFTMIVIYFIFKQRINSQVLS